MQNAALALDCIDPTTVVGADYANALLLYNQGEDLAMRHAYNGGKVPAGTDPCVFLYHLFHQSTV